MAGGVDDVALVGGSAGADAILQLASEQPDLPDQLVLLSPNRTVEGLGEEPKLFIASEDEPLVEVATELAESAPGEDNTALILPGSAHAQGIFDGDQADEALDAMLERLGAVGRDPGVLDPSGCPTRHDGGMPDLRAGVLLRSTRALLCAGVAAMLGVTAHLGAGGLLPSPAWCLAAGAVLVAVNLVALGGPASVWRLVALVAGGQAFWHLVLTARRRARWRRRPRRRPPASPYPQRSD